MPMGRDAGDRTRVNKIRVATRAVGGRSRLSCRLMRTGRNRICQKMTSIYAIVYIDAETFETSKFSIHGLGSHPRKIKRQGAPFYGRRWLDATNFGITVTVYHGKSGRFSARDSTRGDSSQIPRNYRRKRAAESPPRPSLLFLL
ncbi:uncharacterized protein LOC112462715 [Temnothorax curvispinosus]|uniref:Uncharacterized protein LOC112462715 n=1 Tax=Temnothorax curvispinosus TaxID=300111 RepID=A0A6J1QR40_9HYME|nr:uncharacterized protein LOC112462715 [Temnothorax curvispinosus]